MASHFFKFQEGILSLEDDTLIQSFTKRKRVPKFTSIVHGFMACIGILGIGFLSLAYFISDKTNTIARYPGESLRVAISLLVPIVWPGLHVLIFEKFSEKSLGFLCTVQDVVMIIALIYFPAVSTSSLSDSRPEGVGDTMMIAGLVCAYSVALLHLIQLSLRVITFIIDLARGPETSTLAKGLYKQGYSTSIAIYTITACLSLIGFSVMLWSYDFLSNFAQREYHYSDMYAAHTFAGFDVFDALAALHFIVLLWLLANIYSMSLSSKAVPKIFAAIYDFCHGISILIISTRCLIFLNNLDEVCPNGGHCLRIWTEVRPRKTAGIVLGFIVGMLHMLVCLATRLQNFRLRLKNTTSSNPLLHRLNSLNSSEIPFLHNHTWTDAEVLSIFRIKGLTDEARDKIVSVLYKIHNDDVLHTRRRVDEISCPDEESSYYFLGMCGENDGRIKL